MTGQTVEAQGALLSVADEGCLIVVHAVELDVNSAAVVLLGVEGNGLDGDREVEVDDLERSVENISHQVAGEFLPHYEVHQPFLLLLLVGDSLVLLELD
jgi:hypothetical protein